MVAQKNTTAPNRRKVVDIKTKEAVQPHAKMPHQDIDWALAQKPPVLRLFIESWRCESFGKQQKLLKTTLCGRNLRDAIRVLEKAGLFKYEPVMELTKSHRWVIVSWKCENLHGYYSHYWDKPADNSDVGTDSSDVGTENADVGTDSSDVGAENADVGAENADVGAENADVGAENADVGTVSSKKQAETPSEQGVQIRQPRLNHVSTPPQPPTKVVGGGWIETVEEEMDSLRSVVDVGGDPHTPLPPPPENGMVAPPPPSQGLPAVGLRQTLDTEPPATLSEGSHGGGAEIITCPPACADTSRTSAHTPASLEDQTGVSGGAQGDLGRDNFSAAAPPGFGFQIGDRIALDWPESHYHQRVGVVRGLDVEAKEIEVLFDGMAYDLTFSIARVVFAASVVPALAAPPPVPAAAPPPVPAAARPPVPAAVGDEICQLAFANDFPVEEAQKAELSSFTQKQLEVVLKTLQTQIGQGQHSRLRGPTRKERFGYALAMGRRSSPE